MKSYLKRFFNFFFFIHKDDSERLRKQKILNILLFGLQFVDICTIVIYILFLITGHPIDGITKSIQILTLCVAFFVGGFITFFVNNYLSNVLASVIFLTFLTALTIIINTPHELVLGRSLLAFALPIIMAGFLIKPYSSFIAAFIVIILNVFIGIYNQLFPNYISFTIFILIAFMTWVSIVNLEKSIEKYREAYKRESFYKDLFAHDMNNILQNILFPLELFELELKTLHDGSLNEMVTQVKEQIKRGASLVRNVRKYSEFDESEIVLKEIDFKKVLEKAIKSVKVGIKSKEIEVRVESLKEITLIQANKFLYEVFKNLLRNSIIHNENQKVEIIVKISKFRKDKKTFLKAEFIDNGIGIPDSKKKSVFSRGLKEDRSLSGMGLGLSLVKTILESYNATIWVENRFLEDYSKGSNFILLFPEVK